MPRLSSARRRPSTKNRVGLSIAAVRVTILPPAGTVPEIVRRALPGSRARSIDAVDFPSAVLSAFVTSSWCPGGETSTRTGSPGASPGQMRTTATFSL